ncbi:MAG: hypothetical protein JXQ75_09880 [Phycisphaerae bacterium]|nr:hypothetical protein [Phycisphaerae bacterium]
MTGEWTSRGGNAAALGAATPFLLVAALAFAAYLAAAYVVVACWRIMPQGLDRIVSIKSALDQRSEKKETRDVYVLGSSVVLEGVDCTVIDRFLPDGRQSYNLAWTGATPREFLLMLPSLARVHPSMVVIGADVGSVVTPLPNPIPDARLSVAGWWDFIPPSEHGYFRSLFSDHEWETLLASRAEQLLAFRSLPPGAFDAYLREVTRADLRYEGYTTNYKAPWIRRKTVSAEAMERGIERLRNVLAVRRGEDLPEMMEVFGATIEYLRKSGSDVLVVLTPIHPELTSSLEGALLSRATAALEGTARDKGAVFVNHSALLIAEHFSDPGHPCETGRQAWSKALAQVIVENSRHP